ncbi:MAG: dockerin type I repeat-containing protein [Ruminococcus sp.]|nr:dockerin type I repeat-containing protein [Ruminococcus sp.]
MKKIISMLLVLAMMITVLTVGIATTNAAETATITIYGFDGTTEVKEVNVGDEFTVYTTLNVSSVNNGMVGSVQGTQTYTSSVLSLVDEVSGQYGEFTDLVKVFPVTGESTVSNASQAGRIAYNASSPAIDGGFRFDSDHSLLIVTTYKVTAAGTAEVKNAIKNLAASDSAITKIVFEGEVQSGKTVEGKASFNDPTPAIDHAEVRVHTLDGAVETKSFNVGDTFNVYTCLDASSVNEGKMGSINGVQKYTSTVLELADTVDADGYITDTAKVFPIMGDGAIGSAKSAGSVKYAGSSTTGFLFNSARSQLLVTTYRVTANGYADITNKLNVLAAADEDITRIVFNGETQSGQSYALYGSFTTDGPIPTLPPQPPTQPPTEPSTKLKVTIVNPDNTTAIREFVVGDTFSTYTVLNASTTIASLDGTQTYTAAKLQLTDAVSGEYNEIGDKTVMFPILGDEAVATAQNGTIKFNATRGTVNGGYAFNTDDSKLIVTNYKVLAAGEATIKTTLKTLIKDDDAATKIVFNGETQPGQSYEMPSDFEGVTPPPTEPQPTQPVTEPRPTQPPTEPQNKAAVTIYGIDGTSKVKYFDINDEFTVYTTFDASKLNGIHGIGSISASQTYTSSILQSTDEVDELGVVVDPGAMFPILGENTVAKISDGLNKYNASTPGVNKGYVFDNENALLIVTHYKVKAIGKAEVINVLTTVAGDNSALTKIVMKGIVQDGMEIGGYASFTEPGTPEPTEPPATEPPTEPKPTDPPETQPPTQPVTEPPVTDKANVTIYGIDGTTETKEVAVGETFTVYTTFDASQAIGNSMVASISASQTFTSSVLQSADAVDSDGVVVDSNAMFPIMKDKAIAKVEAGLIKYNASTPQINNGFKFDSDKAVLIVTNYKVLKAGYAEVRNALTTVAAADEELTRVVDKGVVADGKTIGGKATFTDPSEPVGPTDAPERYMLGDADNNGKVDAIDVTAIQRKAARMSVPYDEAIMLRNGDVDGNGKLEVIDATYIQRKLAKLKVDYPIGEWIDVQ